MNLFINSSVNDFIELYQLYIKNFLGNVLFMVRFWDKDGVD